MAERLMQIQTPLASDTLLFYQLHAQEELSRPFEFGLTLLSLDKAVNLDEVLGKPVCVQVQLPHGRQRYFSGYVTRLTQGGIVGRFYRYTATVRPWLWFLTRTADCRIFQEMTVPEILKKVFADHGTADFAFKLSASYRKWTYCVQYRETDFNFVSRLMEQEGLCYYFQHQQGRHTMVIGDSTSAHTPFAGYEDLVYVDPARVLRTDQERIDTWDLAREIQPCVYAQDDYDFERPSAALLTRKNVSRKHAEADYEIFDFPGDYLQKADGDHYTAVRMDEYSTQFEKVCASTNAKGICVGSTFGLTGQDREDQNREYLVVSASHELEYAEYEGLPDHNPAEFRSRFVAMPTTQQFRPARTTHKPLVQGPQTAVVVGPSGDEIYTDKYGRVKVQFHWDRYGKKDENSSCWMRVSHPWAGKNWGMIALPRIGQEVIVDFLEGNPDEPIITGRVYNAEQMPPYALPNNMTQTGTKTRSTKGGDPSNFNEIRFEDKKGSEQLFIHAEKNQDIEVEHDETHWVGHNQQIAIVENRTESVGGNESIHITKDRTESVGGNENIRVTLSQSLSVSQDQALSVTGNRDANIDKNEKIHIGKDQTITVGHTRITSVNHDDKLSVHNKLFIDAGEEIVLRAGSASITLQKNGTILIKGNDITLDGNGNIHVKACNNVKVKGCKVSCD